MGLKLSWELHEFTAIQEYKVTDLELLLFNVPVKPRFFSSLLDFLLEACNEFVLF